MKETIVSFPVAKLAKEKGFDEICYSYYKNEELKLGPFCKTITSNLYGKRTEIFKYTNSENDNHITAPTQSLLQKWLREEHQINVESNYLPNIQKYRCLYVPMTMDIPNKEKYSLRSKYYGIDNHETYEQALEEGLQEALKLIS